MKSIKAEAKSSRATKLHAMGGKGSPGKSLDLSPGHTFDGQAGLNSGQVYDTQRIPTRKSGGRVEGERAKARMDRKGARKRADGGSTGAVNKTREDSALSSTPEADYGRGGRGDKTMQYNFDKRPPGDSGRTPRASGGRVGKGKTNITVVVAPQGGAQQPPMPPQKIPVPVPVPPAPPMGGPPGMPPGASPMGGGMPPQMMRKSGGRVKMTAGALSGEGRLQKIALQKAAGK